MRNHSYENDFDLHENETACRTHFRTQTRFETEAQENSEMAYWLANTVFVERGIMAHVQRWLSQ